MDEEQKWDEAENRLEELGTSVIHTAKGTIQTLTIIGHVEGHQIMSSNFKTTKYEHVLPLLAMVEESEDVDGLLVLLNTAGGDIEAGLGIAEMIAGMTKPSVSLVLGGGHSIGIPLAVAANYSFISPTAAMTIHPVRLNGTVIGVSQMFRYFERTQERILQFVTEHSKIKWEDFLRLMLETGELTGDVGSVLYGEEAVQLGLIDQVGGIGDALSYIYEQIRQRWEKAENI